MSTWYEDVEDIKNGYRENILIIILLRTRLDSSSRSSEMLVSLLFSGMGNIRSYDFWEITPEDFFRVFIFFAAVAYCMDK